MSFVQFGGRYVNVDKVIAIRFEAHGTIIDLDAEIKVEGRMTSSLHDPIQSVDEVVKQFNQAKLVNNAGSARDDE